MSSRRKRRWTIILMCLIGLVVSTLSLQAHYRTDETEYCDFGETFNCDIVNRSPWSVFPPGPTGRVPVAAIGIAGYATILLLALIAWSSLGARWFIFVGSTVGTAFAAYLTYIEARVLLVWCILCITSQVAIAMIWLMSMSTLRRQGYEG